MKQGIGIDTLEEPFVRKLRVMDVITRQWHATNVDFPKNRNRDHLQIGIQDVDCCIYNRTAYGRPLWPVLRISCKLKFSYYMTLGRSILVVKLALQSSE